MTINGFDATARATPNFDAGARAALNGERPQDAGASLDAVVRLLATNLGAMAGILCEVDPGDGRTVVSALWADERDVERQLEDTGISATLLDCLDHHRARIVVDQTPLWSFDGSTLGGVEGWAIPFSWRRPAIVCLLYASPPNLNDAVAAVGAMSRILAEHEWPDDERPARRRRATAMSNGSATTPR